MSGGLKQGSSSDKSERVLSGGYGEALLLLILMDCDLVLDVEGTFLNPLNPPCQGDLKKGFPSDKSERVLSGGYGEALLLLILMDCDLVLDVEGTFLNPLNPPCQGDLKEESSSDESEQALSGGLSGCLSDDSVIEDTIV